MNKDIHWMFNDKAKTLLAGLMFFGLCLLCGSCSKAGPPSGSSAVQLPRTGQVASIMAADDGALQKGVAWPSPRFTDNNNGTVTDNLTGLVWLRKMDCFPATNWNNALDAAAALASGSCGLTDNSRTGDWRMPNINELSSLVSIAALNPALPSNPFTFNPLAAVPASRFWSSSTFAQGAQDAWLVHMDMGYVDKVSKKKPLYLLPVRGDGRSGSVALPKTGQTVSYALGDDGRLQKGAAWPSPRFTDNKDGTVTDHLTGLVWLKNANCLDETIVGANSMQSFGLMKWPQAMAWTSALSAGFCGLTDGSSVGDWRAPNRSEMASLIDRSRASPALPAGHPFDNVQPEGYWTSSSLETYDGKPHSQMGWHVHTANGVVSVGGMEKDSNYVWPVRGASR